MADVGALRRSQGRISSRENVVPAPANAPPPADAGAAPGEIAGSPGSAAADGLSFVDLPPGSLRAGGDRPWTGPVRVFAFDAAYQAHYPSIRLVVGSFDPAERC